MLTLVYRQNDIVCQSHDISLLPELLADDSRVFWLDMEAPSTEEFQILANTFHFHPLTIEDSMRPHQRPKIDEFDGYFFVIADEVQLNVALTDGLDAATGRVDDLQVRQLSLFLGPHYLVTIHIQPVQAVVELRDRCDRSRHVLQHGPDYLLYALLDALVDGYFPILEGLDERMDALEDSIIGYARPNVLDTIFQLKRNLTRLRRLAGPLREVLQTLTTRDYPNISPSALPYFRDVADHLFRVYETLDSYRDLMSNMLDAYLSQTSNQMNLVMQKLSIVATVFLPITFVTGVFGMNFSDQPWFKTSFWFWAICMGGVAVFTYWWFHRRHWV